MTGPSARGADNPLRLVLIAADLLPQEIVQGRRTRVVRRIVIAAFVLVAAGLGGWYAWVSAKAADARVELATIEADVARLQAGQGQYAKVVATREQSDAVHDQLELLMARDLHWAWLLDSVDSAAADGITIDSIGTSVTEAKAPGTGGGGQETPDTPIGSLIISGSGTSTPQVADYVDALADVKGLANPLVNNTTRVSETKVQFTLYLDVTAEALGGRYTDGAGED
jgi:hypothetical protein